MIPLLYVSKSIALANGATHEGRLFGVPVWFYDDPMIGNEVMAAAKFPVTQLWLWLCDGICELLTYFIDEHQVIELPITVKGAIR